MKANLAEFLSGLHEAPDENTHEQWNSSCGHCRLVERANVFFNGTEEQWRLVQGDKVRSIKRRSLLLNAIQGILSSRKHKSCTLKYIDNCLLAENCNCYVSDATAIKRCPLPVYLCLVYEV